MIQDELPYAGTSGWSGTDTSRERAEDMDSTGKTAVNQRLALSFLERQGFYGATWRDLASWYDWHHGTASGVLTTLHKAGRVVRLLERRDRSRIYVVPRFQAGRECDEPAVRMTQTEMFKTLNYLHSRMVLSMDHGGVRFLEQKLDAYWPNWKDE